MYFFPSLVKEFNPRQLRYYDKAEALINQHIEIESEKFPPFFFNKFFYRLFYFFPQILLSIFIFRKLCFIFEFLFFMEIFITYHFVFYIIFFFFFVIFVVFHL